MLPQNSALCMQPHVQAAAAAGLPSGARMHLAALGSNNYGVQGLPDLQPSVHAQMQAMLVMQNPELASQLTRQAAEQYEQAVNAAIDPDVTEMAHNFNLDDRSTRALDLQMKNRKATFDEDMEALWQILGGARNPSGLLMVKVREMADGVFRGFSTPEKHVSDFAKKHRLDAQASAKLAEVLAKRQDPQEDMRKLSIHLERSNKPSALMMLMLKDLRAGKPVKEPEHVAAMGSSAHMKELKQEKARHSRSRDRRSRERRKRSRSRSRSRGRRR